MAKRKTKEQKKLITRNRSKNTSSLKPLKKERVVEYGYSQSLIRGDLFKTLLISLLILGIEVGLYFVLS